MRGKGALAIDWFGLKLIILPGKPPGIIRAAKQYDVAPRIIDLCTFDVTHNPWRCGELFDAIVTDPPCRFDVDAYVVIDSTR